jgi:hypothetical protein
MSTTLTLSGLLRAGGRADEPIGGGNMDRTVELDRLSITLCPELIGAGARLFGDGPAGSSWSLAQAAPTSSGALCLRYDLIRPAAGR